VFPVEKQHQQMLPAFLFSSACCHYTRVCSTAFSQPLELNLKLLFDSGKTCWGDFADFQGTLHQVFSTSSTAKKRGVSEAEFRASRPLDAC
jgi:hypothetical protein